MELIYFTSQGELTYYFFSINIVFAFILRYLKSKKGASAFLM